MEDQNRINLLEQRVESFATDVQGMNGKLDGIATALSSLVRIEERQISHDEKLSEVKAAATDRELRIRKLELAVPDELATRLTLIEVAMPSLIESRKWVVGGVLAGIGMIGVSLVHIVLKA